MSWQDNRRRKRTWYKHYRNLCDQLVELTNASTKSGNPIAAEAIVKMFFDLYELRRMHKRRRVAESAFESLELAAKDSGITSIAIMPRVSATAAERLPSIGEFGATSRTSTAPAEYRSSPPELVTAFPVREEKEIPF